jgi:hypothetical protein
VSSTVPYPLFYCLLETVLQLEPPFGMQEF